MHSDGGLLYARSSDGLAWEKPNLGLVEAFGSTQNNIVYHTGGGPAQTGVFFDEHTNVFRMFGKNFGVGMRTGTQKGSVGVASSRDGIHNWTNWTAAASMGLQRGADTSNNALWGGGSVSLTDASATGLIVLPAAYEEFEESGAATLCIPAGVCYLAQLENDEDNPRHEEKLHLMIKQSKIDTAKEEMKRKAVAIKFQY